MFVIELLYKADLSEIDAHMKAHVAFLKKHYASGHFLVSGRKIPRDGGIIVAVGKNRAEIEAVVKSDPFVTRGLADFRIIEFRASQLAPDIEKVLEKEGFPRRGRRRARRRRRITSRRTRTSQLLPVDVYLVRAVSPRATPTEGRTPSS
jgi:uncharacterized protein YciI